MVLDVNHPSPQGPTVRSAMSVDPREAARFGFFDDPVTDLSYVTPVSDRRFTPPDQRPGSDPLTETSYRSDSTHSSALSGSRDHVPVFEPTETSEERSFSSFNAAPVNTTPVAPLASARPELNEKGETDPVKGGHGDEKLIADQKVMTASGSSRIESLLIPNEQVSDPTQPVVDKKEKVSTMEDVPVANVHARRRMGVFGAVAALLFAVGTGSSDLSLTMLSGQVKAMSATPVAPDDTTSATAASVLQTGLGAARQNRATTGTYRGTLFPEGIVAVTGNDVVVLTAVVNGSCWYTAIVPDYDSSPKWDATAKRCNPQRLSQLQADLDAGE
jgi:hypothetical protein